MRQARQRPGEWLDACPDRCPGCAHRHLSREASLAQKQGWLRERLAPWADRLRAVRAVRAQAGESYRGYRDRACLAARWGETEGWRFGLMRADTLIAIPDCPVHSPRINALYRLLAAALPAPSAFPLAYWVQSGAQATLVLKGGELPDPSWLDAGVREGLARIGMEGLWLHLFPAVGRRIFTKNGWHLAWGVPRSRDGSGALYGPTAFQQLVPPLFAEALDEAEAFLDPRRGDALVDLYCGNGTTLRRWSRRGAEVLGVELGGEAVENARRNAPAAQVLRGAAAARVPQLRQWSGDRGDSGGRRLLYLNPPRTGLEPVVTAWAAQEFRAARIAYLSCSAGTLSRDLERLAAAGYRIERLSPYDFFPRTYHVEVLALLALEEGGTER